MAEKWYERRYDPTRWDNGIPVDVRDNFDCIVLKRKSPEVTKMLQKAFQTNDLHFYPDYIPLQYFISAETCKEFGYEGSPGYTYVMIPMRGELYQLKLQRGDWGRVPRDVYRDMLRQLRTYQKSANWNALVSGWNALGGTITASDSTSCISYGGTADTVAGQVKDPKKWTVTVEEDVKLNSSVLKRKPFKV